MGLLPNNNLQAKYLPNLEVSIHQVKIEVEKKIKTLNQYAENEIKVLRLTSFLHELEQLEISINDVRRLRT